MQKSGVESVPPSRIYVTDSVGLVGLDGSIRSEMLPKIFDLFTQADRTSDCAPGRLGIGLKFAHCLAGLQGGTVTGQSDGSDQGSGIVLN